MSSKINLEEYQKRLSEATNTIVPISEYVGWYKPITYKCIVCNHEWKAKEARSAIRYGCPNCAKNKRLEVLNEIHKSNLKSEEQFRKELAEKQPNLIPNDEYVNDNTKYHCICKIHKCDVFTTPSKYLRRNQGCKLCAIERDSCATRYSHHSFVGKLSSINPNLEVLSEYTNIKDRIDIRCKICGHKWKPIAESLVAKISCGCPKCAGNAVKESSTFEEELKITHSELQLLSPYIRSNRKVHVLCTDCNKDFWVTPNKLQQGQHCPHCKISHGERFIRDVLTNLNIEFEMQKRFDDLKGLGNRKLSYDFYLPTYNLLIEFQGEQHERPVIFKGLTEKITQERFIKQQEHDKRKRNYAESHNIGLLEIWYYDINLVEDILLKVLKADTSKSA